MEGKAEWYRKKALKRANENEKVPKMEEVPKPANTMMKFVTKGVAKSDKVINRKQNQLPSLQVLPKPKLRNFNLANKTRNIMPALVGYRDVVFIKFR